MSSSASEPGPSGAPTPDHLGRRFPPDFLWGAATSAYQIEGAVDADGRGESIWDRFSHTPGRTAGGDTGDVACDHYRRVDEDLDLIAALGLRAYRFSLAWPRVQPEGRGPANQRGLDFYRRLVEGLLERGVVPVATLYHWDLPGALQDAGGWTRRDTVARFADYADLVARSLGDVVSFWITHNEPWVTAFLGHALGIHAPGVRDWPAAFAVAHHLLLSHGEAAQVFDGDAQVGVALDLYPVSPASSSSQDEAAATRMDGWRNRWFLDPLLRGEYPLDLLEEHRRHWGEPAWLRDGDLDAIRRRMDFLGMNFYSRLVVEAGDGEDPFGARRRDPQHPLTAMGWEVAPDGLRAMLLRLRSDYRPVPVYITENGAAYDDSPDADGIVRDEPRIDYLRRHVAAVADARKAGVDVRGYFVWSLMDNFEWTEGYSKRFGLVHVDYASQRRTPKDSAHWYRKLIRASRDGGGGRRAEGPA